MRKKLNFDCDWLFHDGDIVTKFPAKSGQVYAQAKCERALYGPASRYYSAYENEGRPADAREMCVERWDKVKLPHDYIIKQEPKEEYNNGTGFFDYHNAWYRKKFFADKNDKGKRHIIFFEGVASRATVYLNGCFVTKCEDGYISFEADITDLVDFDGENVLAVYVESKTCDGWWYEGGGIYRHVHYIVTEPVAVDTYGVYVKPQKASDSLWNIALETTLVCDRDEKTSVSVETLVYAPDGNLAAKAVCDGALEKYSRTTLKYKTEITSPMLWDLDTPNLYNAKTNVYEDGKLCDTYETRFGFRTFLLDPNHGLFLNGKHVKIKGICAHGDFGLTGKAVPDNVQRHRVKLIREMGANGFRASHYPHSEATMDALDEMGFIVMNETRRFESCESSLKALEMLVKRDRNRPSVLFWSTGNEEAFHGFDRGARIQKRMAAFIKKLDDTRVITCAYSLGDTHNAVGSLLEAIGVNYTLGYLDKAHQNYPDIPVFSSENAATGTTRAHYLPNSIEHAFVNALDANPHNGFSSSREETWKTICEREFVLGGYQWIAFEHRGEAVWPRICSVSGAIDIFLNKKDAFYQNKSMWCEAPMIHLATHWNFLGLEGENMTVSAYTNCTKAELFLNGESLGCKAVEKYTPVKWDVKYAPGELKVIGYNGEAKVCEDIRKSSKAADKLVLKAQNSAQANGDDLLLVTCFAIDEDGTEVPDAEPYVKFFASENAEIVGTGSSNIDHTPVHIPDRQMYAGKITVALRLKEHGTVKLYAKADRLKMGVLTLEV